MPCFNITNEKICWISWPIAHTFERSVSITLPEVFELLNHVRRHFHGCLQLVCFSDSHQCTMSSSWLRLHKNASFKTICYITQTVHLSSFCTLLQATRRVPLANTTKISLGHYLIWLARNISSKSQRASGAGVRHFAKSEPVTITSSAYQKPNLMSNGDGESQKYSSRSVTSELRMLAIYIYIYIRTYHRPSLYPPDHLQAQPQLNVV